MEPPRLMALRLAREGFCGGDPARVWELEVDWVMDAWELLVYQSEYEETLSELNKPTP